MLEAFSDDDAEAGLEFEMEDATDEDLAELRRHLTPKENARLKLRLER